MEATTREPTMKAEHVALLIAIPIALVEMIVLGLFLLMIVLPLTMVLQKWL